MHSICHMKTSPAAAAEAAAAPAAAAEAAEPLPAAAAAAAAELAMGAMIVGVTTGISFFGNNTFWKSHERTVSQLVS